VTFLDRRSSNRNRNSEDFISLIELSTDVLSHVNDENNYTNRRPTDIKVMKIRPTYRLSMLIV